MECFPDADTVGNEDEIGSTCFNLMWMDCVRGDEELPLPGQGDVHRGRCLASQGLLHQ